MDHQVATRRAAEPEGCAEAFEVAMEVDGVDPRALEADWVDSSPTAKK